MAHALKRWRTSLFSDAKMKMLMVQEVILKLDNAQDHRIISQDESWLRDKLKKCILGWAVLEKARKKQCSIITYLREGDANTIFFHHRANGKRRKNFIQRLHKGDGWAYSHDEKKHIVQQHFEGILA